MARDPGIDLEFTTFTDLPIHTIKVFAENNDELAVWRDPLRTLYYVAPEMLKRARKVVACWEQGDLAAAVRDLAEAVAKADGEDEGTP